MELSIEAASRAIENYTGDRFWLDGSVVTRTFAPTDRACLTFDDCDDGAGIGTVTGLIVKLDLDDSGTYETTLTITTDFLLRPGNAAVMVPARPFTSLLLTGTYLFPSSAYNRELVQVTAKWGWPAVPANVTKACLIVATELFKSKDAAFGVVGDSQFGQLRVSSGVARQAQMLLAGVRRPAVG
jgi:hypothetical protein